MSRVFFVLLNSVFLLVMGCQQESPQLAPAASRLAASKLSILVVDDSPLAAGIKLLRGEWSERSGGELEIQEGTIDQLLAATELSADLVIFPSRHLGTLVDRDWLRTVRKSVLQSADVAIDDMFPLIRNVTLPYGSQVYALTLGEPPLMLVDRDFVGPKKWDDIDNPSTLGSSQLRYPYAVALIARGVSYAQNRGDSSGWFDSETMQPRIAEPPYVKALSEMLGNEMASTNEKADVAIGWPAAGAANSPRYSSLPLADEVYNPLRDIWEKGEEGKPITFLGFAGRSVSVTKATRNSASAFKLMRWLVSEKIATQLSPRSEATVWFRKSQMANSKRWLPKNVASDESAANVSKLLSSSNFYLLPRIPGVDDYLEVLEKAITWAISANLTAEEALAEVVVEWNSLTNRYDRDWQRAAYRRHLGLHESKPQ